MSLESRWRGMHARCNDKKSKRYGGRGIKVCKTWRSFKAFEKWAMQNGYHPDLEIDRINNDGDYKPSNCRFVTQVVNVRNSTAAKLTEEQVAIIRGRLQTGQTKASLAKQFGVSVGTITAVQKFKTWRGVETVKVDVTSVPWSLRRNSYPRAFLEDGTEIPRDRKECYAQATEYNRN